MSRRILTPAQVRKIAKVYDGKSETIDALIEEFGCRRHNIYKAAKNAGYKTNRERIQWDDKKDAYLVANWGKIPPTEVYAYLKCSPASVFNRLKRIGHSTRDNTDLTIADLESLTKMDHRLWHRFIEDGWLHSYNEYGRNGETWSIRVTVTSLHKFLRSHPEVINYRALDKFASGVLELNKLPDPPKFMRLTCRSDGWKDGIRATPTGKKIHHGEITLVDREHKFTMESCAVVGGTDIWAELYTSVNCPRCGCTVSRFSEKAIFSNDDPGQGDALNAIAGKLGLTWNGRQFQTAAGECVDEEQLLHLVFQSKRNPGDSFNAFRKLLQAGINVVPPTPVVDPVHTDRMRYKLRPKQKEAFEEFLRTGNVGVYWPPGVGKMYFLGMIFAAIDGEHILFVHSKTLRDQWIAFFLAHAKNARVAYVKSPYHYRIDILDSAGDVVSQVRIFCYMTRGTFEDGRFKVVGYDEAQFLPGNRAYRQALLKTDYRVGLSATPFREDGRADLIQMMTGASIGEDWKEFKDAGDIIDVPVRVIVVKNIADKMRALRRIVGKTKTIIFSDALEDGEQIAKTLGIPFIRSGTKAPLQLLAQHRCVCMSRVGDCGLDVPALEEVIEYNFHHGSRAQSLQRLGRLLHASKPLLHTVLMTVKEFSLYHKRLSAMELKGFSLRIQMYTPRPRRGRPPAPKPVNQWLQILGIKTLQPTTGCQKERHGALREKMRRNLEGLAEAA